MKQTFSKIILTLTMFLLVAQPFVADAQLVQCGLTSQNVETENEKKGGVYVQERACTINDLTNLVYIIVNYLIGMAGFVAIFFVVWGGVQMLLSGGNPERIKDGKSTIFNALLGLVLTLLSYLIVGYVAGFIIPGAVRDPLKNLLEFMRFS